MVGKLESKAVGCQHRKVSSDLMASLPTTGGMTPNCPCVGNTIPTSRAFKSMRSAKTFQRTVFVCGDSNRCVAKGRDASSNCSCDRGVPKDTQSYGEKRPGWDTTSSRATARCESPPKCPEDLHTSRSTISTDILSRSRIATVDRPVVHPPVSPGLITSVSPSRTSTSCV